MISKQACDLAIEMFDPVVCLKMNEADKRKYIQRTFENAQRICENKVYKIERDEAKKFERMMISAVCSMGFVTAVCIVTAIIMTHWQG